MFEGQARWQVCQDISKPGPGFDTFGFAAGDRIAFAPADCFAGLSSAAALQAAVPVRRFQTAAVDWDRHTRATCRVRLAAVRESAGPSFRAVHDDCQSL